MAYPTTLKITLKGATKYFPSPHIEDHEGTTDAEKLVEFAGRSCYQSWHRPNPSTATAEGYVDNVYENGHFSVFEHGSITFYLEGVSRALTHELIRHRHLSPSQLSMRFVKPDGAYVLPPFLRDATGAEADRLREDLDTLWVPVLSLYNRIYDYARSQGQTLKQAREAARSVLPHMTETKILITGNHRAFYEFLTKRNDPMADAEIQELAQKLLHCLYGSFPSLYKHLVEQSE